MTHEGRMLRGKENYEKGILLDNEDTKYFLKNKSKEEAIKEAEEVVEEAEEVEEKPKKKKGVKADGDN